MLHDLHFIMYIQVRSFDPTVTGPTEGFSWPHNLSFERIGISNETGEEKDGNERYKFDSLDNLVNR